MTVTAYIKVKFRIFKQTLWSFERTVSSKIALKVPGKDGIFAIGQEHVAIDFNERGISVKVVLS